MQKNETASQTSFPDTDNEGAQVIKYILLMDMIFLSSDILMRIYSIKWYKPSVFYAW